MGHGHGPWAIRPWSMGHGPWLMAMALAHEPYKAMDHGPWALGHGPWPMAMASILTCQDFEGGADHANHDFAQNPAYA